MKGEKISLGNQRDVAGRQRKSSVAPALGEVRVAVV